MNVLKSQTQPAPIAATASPVYTVGTLSYTQKQLSVLFFWLMWNEFTITLLEQVPSLTTVLFKDRGASNTFIALLGSIGGIAGMWINPFFSTWSDRTRTRFGRRRPFLFVSIPLFTLGLIAIPYMPDFYHYLMGYEWAARYLRHLPVDGEILFIGIGSFVDRMFNGVVLAIFSYYYWDVVPESVLGRFNSLAKIFALSAGLFWSFFLFGLAEHNMKEVFLIVSLTCSALYLISVWMVKEGEYPPPEPIKKKGLWEPIRLYFVDCFSKPYYLWIFVGTFVYQLGNAGNNYQFFYLHYDLGLSLADIGWSQGWAKSATTIFGVTLGFLVGTMTDRLKPIRMIPLTLFIWALLCLASYFFVHDKVSYLFWFGLTQIVSFVYGIAVGAVTVELFPREKLGQFCSAQAVFHQLLFNLTNPTLISPFFDWIQNNRLGFLWSALFYFLAAIISVKVYFNWKKQQPALS